MAEKKRGLGRGLDILLGNNATKIMVESAAATDSFRLLPIDVLQRGKYQPRKEMAQESLQELAESIRTQGIIQPIVIRKISPDRYEILAGERRWRAAQLVGLTDVPTIIKTVSDEAAMAVALIENIQREDLNPMEEAFALQRLLEEFSMTHQEIAEAIGKSRTTVTNQLRLLGLHPEVKSLLEQRRIEMGHARAILSLEGEKQWQLAKVVVSKALNVRDTEHLVRQMQKGSTPTENKKNLDSNIRQLQQNLSEKLGTTVRIEHTAKGKGKLIVHYNTLDELDGILGHIK